MPDKKILIAPNSFKECIDSVSVSLKIYDHLKLALGNYSLFRMPLSDGGDGFLETTKFNNKTFEQKYYNINTYGNQFIRVPVVITANKLYIESADVIGLKLVPPANRRLLQINTASLGELLIKIDSDNRAGLINIDSVIIGIGGTATNDLGLGALEVFGFKLLDKRGGSLKVIPSEFRKANKIIWDGFSLSFKLQAIIDVNTPLTGRLGSAALFAKQKGASEEDLSKLEEGFINILNLIRKQGIYEEIESLPGAGGGLAAGLLIFLGAKLKTAKEFIEEGLRFNEIPGTLDFLITGEGSFDWQSFYGKSTGIILKQFPYSRKFIICGSFNADPSLIKDNVTIIELVKYFSSREESMRNFDKAIGLACEEIISDIRREV